MAKNPLPSYNWFSSDWLGSRAHAVMTLEQQGAYRNLLDHAWESDPPCSLPDDDAELAQLSGAGKRWARMAIKIRQWFSVKDGRLWNERMRQGFERALQLHEARKLGGKHSKGKLAQELRDNLSTLQAQLELNRSLAGGLLKVPTPTPTSTPTEDTTKKNPADSPSSEIPTPVKLFPPLDSELKEVIEKTDHLRSLLDPLVARWWGKMLAKYETVEELYVFDELAGADIWLEANPGRRPSSNRGLQRFLATWFGKAEEKARQTAAKVAATRRIYATEAPKRFHYQPGR